MRAEFYVVCTPGLEELLLDELQEISGFLLGPRGTGQVSPPLQFEIHRGGIAFEADLFLGLQFHWWTKIASRIYLRIAKFHAIEFSYLERELKKMQISKWVGKEPFSLQVAAQKSKLGQEKRIWQTASQVWKKQLVEEGAAISLSLRAEHDEFVLSLDLTGDHLHLRATGRTLTGPAPLRETLAAALLRFLMSAESLAGLQAVTLLDPMAGSGTLLSEAAQIFSPLSSRGFAFQNPNMNWIPAILRSPAYLKNYRHFHENPFAQLVGDDNHKKAQFRSLPEFSDLKNLRSRDELPSENLSTQVPRLWVVANPPYGERLEALPAASLRDLLLKEGPERVAVILPLQKGEELKGVWPQGWQFQSIRVSNGGIPCQMLRGEK